MATKKPHPEAADVIAATRERAKQAREQFQHKPGPSELLTPQELADAAPFHFVLRDYIRQLKAAREAAGVTLAELSSRSGLAVETLSRLETGALTNPTWKTLGVFAAALGLRPEFSLAGVASESGHDGDPGTPRMPATRATTGLALPSEKGTIQE
jgi:transcriptional regulator with XRE-family HTH domain